MSFEEMVEDDEDPLRRRHAGAPAPHSCGRGPFRAPHHTISPAGLSGGGTIPAPGRALARAQRRPLSGRASRIRAIRHGGAAPADRGRRCHHLPRERFHHISLLRHAGGGDEPPAPADISATPRARAPVPRRRVARYLSRVSGPLLDRLDIHVEVPPVEFDKLASEEKAEPSSEIKKRVNSARERQRLRFAGTPIPLQREHDAAHAHGAVPPFAPGARNMLRLAFDRLGLSARAYDRVLKVARTIADLARIRRHSAGARPPRRSSTEVWTGNTGRVRL